MNIYMQLLGESSKLLRKIDPKSMDATDGNRLEMIMEIMQGEGCTVVVSVSFRGYLLVVWRS